jgi:hypothetical protein
MHNETAIVPSDKIDKEKWNNCIAASSNSLIYATTDYLDHLADNWTGIILNDYEAVMPVPLRKKWGIRYCYDVPFIQQLGVFPAKNEDFVLFKKALGDLVSYGDYAFNYANNTGYGSLQTNFVMQLDGAYNAKFSTDVQQNIRRSQGFGHVYKKCKSDVAIEAFIETNGPRTSVRKEEFNRFKNLAAVLEKKGRVVGRKVVSPNENLLSAVLLLDDGRRLYNIMNSTFSEGKGTEANYFLLSNVWQEFEGSGRCFDFEGSDLPGVKEFYKKFGGVNESYTKVHFNHLPWPMKILKK